MQINKCNYKCNYKCKIDDTDSIECEHSVHSNGKCILHCDKEDWNLPEQVANELDIQLYADFVAAVREELRIKNNDLHGVIFPKTKINISLFYPAEKAYYQDGNDFLTIRLNIWNCIFSEDVVFEIVDVLDLKNSIFQKKVTIGDKIIEFNSNNSHYFTLEIIGDKRNFKKLNKLFFHISSFDNLIIKSLEYDTIFIDDSKIQNLSFERTSIKSHLKLRDNPVIKSAKLDILLFEENSYAEIEGCNFDDLTIKDCQSKPEHFSFLNCNITKNLTVSGSELNNYTFDTVDASKAKILMINTNFMGNTFTKFNNVKWGEFILSKDVKNRDTFRQLKHVNDQQGNYIQANKFYALEMEKYGEEVSPSKNFQEWLVFVISKNLSNFSQDWTKPIAWFLFMSVFLYNFLILYTIDLVQVRELFFPSYVLLSNYKLILIPNILLFITCAISSQNLNFIKFRSGVYFMNAFAMSYSLLVYEMVRELLPDNIISFHNFLEFINPFQVYIPENNTLYLALMIIHRLLAIVIGYHLVTALRFNTRRK